jgi:hypothetical protein
MALITATAGPSDDIRTTDIPGSNGRIAGFEVDGVTIYLGTYSKAEDKDAAIVATANMLIGVLVGLRDAAGRRIAIHEADLADWAPGEIVAVFGR